MRAVSLFSFEDAGFDDGGPDDPEFRKTAGRALVRALFRKPEPPWTGEVIRRPESEYRQRSVIEIFRCPNSACRHWLKKPTPEKPSWCKVCRETATYLDLLASEALDAERRGLTRPTGNF